MKNIPGAADPMNMPFSPRAKALQQAFKTLFKEMNIEADVGDLILQPQSYDFMLPVRLNFKSQDLEYDRDWEYFVDHYLDVACLLLEANKDAVKLRNNPSLKSAWEKYQTIKDLSR